MKPKEDSGLRQAKASSLREGRKSANPGKRGGVACVYVFSYNLFYQDDLFILFSLNVIDSLAHLHLHVTLGFTV